MLAVMGEFDLIARYFRRPARRAALGIGDDCALLPTLPGQQLAISSDMLVEGRHFFADVDPASLGHKALAVNLSDLAACGAEPLGFTLALALPQVDEAWLAGFSQGLLALADAEQCELMGGDTTRGPLNICITVFGTVPVATGVENGGSQALLRSGAKPGDDVYVSGSLGDARLGLDAMRGRIRLPPALLDTTRRRLEMPTPRVALGMALRGVASAAIDLSDGLAGDLQHVLKASHVGASIDTAAALHLLAARRHADWPLTGLSQAHALNAVLSGGDDYELAFAAPAAQRHAVEAAALASHTVVSRIGRIDEQPGLRWLDAAGQPVADVFASFDHFA